MKVTFRGVVEVDGVRDYARGFWDWRAAERWFLKRAALAMLAPRSGEVVYVVDAQGREVARVRQDDA